MRSGHEKPVILIASAILLLSTTLFPSSTAAVLGDSLNTSRPLYDGETLVSAGGTFALGFFSPNSTSDKRYVAIWYHSISSHDVVWVANGRNPVHGSAGSLALSPNGTLLISDRHNSTAIWSSASNSSTNISNPLAQLIDIGNFIVREAAAAGDNYAWQSFDYPSNTILNGMFIGWDKRTGLNRAFTSWVSPTDPSPGAYITGMRLSGVPQQATMKGDGVYCRRGPWVGNKFAGAPELSTFQIINITFVADSERVGYYYHPVGDGLLTRLRANPDGTAQRLVWVEPPGQWNVFWTTPGDKCDAFALCGPFGVCDADDSPLCRCLWGFRPLNPARWRLRNGSDGCVRNTALDCRRNGTSTDGFVTVSGVKLPDTTAAVGNRSLGLDECRTRCLMNCSCTGFSVVDATAGGSGCIMWAVQLNDMRLYSSGGQELYVRVAAADVPVNSTVSSHSDDKSRTVAVVVVPIVGGLLVGFILISYVRFHHNKRNKRRRFPEEDEETASESDIDLPLFDLETIAEATNNFSEENKLGEGGFGPVYKGSKEGKEIAVKRLSKGSTQGLDEFKNEVMLIAKLQHRNLVLLLGCCVQKQERILIYEYMPNKSLDTFLFDKGKKGLLNWQLRYHIIIGIARGLLYLHQDSVLRIVHRDLKASNILLNREMVPKISDFGLARIFDADETKTKTKRVVGTYGYMSPEYLMNGIFSVKSDVFSFGVLVLEIISGQRNIETFTTQFSYHLLQQAWSLWKEGERLELVDESMGNSFSISEVLKCIKVGLLCVQEHPDDRPLMASVILMLTSDKEELPEPKRPGFVTRMPSFETDQSSSGKPESPFSSNDLTLTMPHGR